MKGFGAHESDAKTTENKHIRLLEALQYERWFGVMNERNLQLDWWMLDTEAVRQKMIAKDKRAEKKIKKMMRTKSKI